MLILKTIAIILTTVLVYSIFMTFLMGGVYILYAVNRFLIPNRSPSKVQKCIRNTYFLIAFLFYRFVNGLSYLNQLFSRKRVSSYLVTIHSSFHFIPDRKHLDHSRMEALKKIDDRSRLVLDDMLQFIIHGQCSSPKAHQYFLKKRILNIKTHNQLLRYKDAKAALADYSDQLEQIGIEVYAHKIITPFARIHTGSAAALTYVGTYPVDHSISKMFQKSAGLCKIMKGFHLNMYKVCFQIIDMGKYKTHLKNVRIDDVTNYTDSIKQLVDIQES